jgi:hypothetical protein
MQGMWVRFFPLVTTRQKLLLQDKVIGNVRRIFYDFGLDVPLASLPAPSRLKHPVLGAGSLLDIGIYSITWGILALEDQTVTPSVQPVQTIIDGIDVSSSILLFYASTGKHGILTCTMQHKTDTTSKGVMALPCLMVRQLRCLTPLPSSTPARMQAKTWETGGLKMRKFYKRRF